MKESDNSSFEKQLMQSATRMRDKQNYQLPLRKSPRMQRPSFTWGIAAAAAIFGWFFGVTFPVEGERSKYELAISNTPDTIIQYREKVVHDTIVKEMGIPVKTKTHIPSQHLPLQQATRQGCNVECDGIDYEMLLRM